VIPPGLGGLVRLLLLGPGEWLVVSDMIEGAELHNRLNRHIGREDLAVVDFSCALKTLRVEGPAAREPLSKGCGLDLHPTSFPAGRSTRTRFAQLSVILECTDPTPRFELYVGRSYLTYLHSWLLDAAAEFSVDHCPTPLREGEGEGVR
jgi:sarcosine oxidase subunit gamma